MPSSRAPHPLRAAIDIGTNTLLAAIGRACDDGTLELVADRQTITRLGEGVDRTHTLCEPGMKRALEALATFVGEARALGAISIAAVATSAVRDASNRDEFLTRARAIAGDNVRTISGDEEARLTFSGAAFDVTVANGAPVLVFDVGGGSTEISFGPLGGAPIWHRSIDVGSVRLTERFVHHDPPGNAELMSIERVLEEALAPLAPPVAPFSLLGLAATVTTLAAIENGGQCPRPAVLTLESVERMTLSLASQSLGVRSAIAGLDPRRADVIVAGAALVRAIMRWSGATLLHASAGGVRIGLLRAAIAAEH